MCIAFPLFLAARGQFFEESYSNFGGEDVNIWGDGQVENQISHLIKNTWLKNHHFTISSKEKNKFANRILYNNTIVKFGNSSADIR